MQRGADSKKAATTLCLPLAQPSEQQGLQCCSCEVQGASAACLEPKPPTLPSSPAPLDATSRLSCPLCHHWSVWLAGMALRGRPSVLVAAALLLLATAAPTAARRLPGKLAWLHAAVGAP